MTGNDKWTEPLVLRIYNEEYKAQTALGEKHKAAHYTGLEAVYEAAKRSTTKHPMRRAAALSVRKLADRIVRWIDA